MTYWEQEIAPFLFMETYKISVIAPNKTEHERIQTFIKENNVLPVSQTITRDIYYSYVLLELTEQQYSDLIDLGLNSTIKDLT